MGPSKMSFLEIRVVFHLHDCGRKGTHHLLFNPTIIVQWKAKAPEDEFSFQGQACSTSMILGERVAIYQKLIRKPETMKRHS